MPNQPKSIVAADLDRWISGETAAFGMIAPTPDDPPPAAANKGDLDAARSDEPPRDPLPAAASARTPAGRLSLPDQARGRRVRAAVLIPLICGGAILIVAAVTLLGHRFARVEAPVAALPEPFAQTRLAERGDLPARSAPPEPNAPNADAQPSPTAGAAPAASPSTPVAPPPPAVAPPEINDAAMPALFRAFLTETRTGRERYVDSAPVQAKGWVAPPKRKPRAAGNPQQHPWRRHGWRYPTAQYTDNETTRLNRTELQERGVAP